MKLYATTTSERATKGQGGNEYLNIDIQVEQSDGVRVALCSIEVKRVVNKEYLGQDEYEASCLHNFDRKIIASVPFIDIVKGNKQKTAKCNDCGTEELPDKMGNCSNCGKYIKSQ